MIPPRVSNSQIRRLSGFGFQYFARHDAYVVRPTHEDELAEWLNFARTSGRKVVLRGQGRSYGDASVFPEGIAIDLSYLNKLELDPTIGIAMAGAGCTIADLWRTGLPHGWWPPVVSGTMFPSLGGALGMNIHGKNAYKVGTLGEHVRELRVMRVDGSVETLTPSDAEFYAVVSGAGQFAVILGCTIQMKRIHSGYLDVKAVSCRHWDEQFEAFDQHTEEWDYCVAWVDAFSGGNSAGRGLFHAARYRDDGLGLTEADQDLPANILGVVPKSRVWPILKALNRRSAMKLLNAVKHASGVREAKKGLYRQSLVGFSFLLDYVPNWQQAYSPHGFIQYQSFVPKEQAREVFAEQARLQQTAGLENFLTVLKRHRADPFWLSHGVDGYSLAQDFKIEPGRWTELERLCHTMNDLVLQAGGRFYLAKDSTLRDADVETWLGSDALANIRKLKSEWDPQGVLTSLQSERLGLFNPVSSRDS